MFSDTAAKLTINDEKHSLVTSQTSRLRQKTATILSETDKRYAGKQTSRKHLDSEGTIKGFFHHFRSMTLSREIKNFSVNLF